MSSLGLEGPWVGIYEYCDSTFYELHLFSSLFKGLLEMRPSERGPLTTEKIKFTLFYEVF